MVVLRRSRVARCRLLLLLLLAATLARPNAVRACNGEPLKVAVDIGHSEQYPGAISARGKPEHAFNKRFAEELIARSRELPGLELFAVAHRNGQSYGNDLAARPRFAAANGAHVFLSIHHDSVNRKYIRTWEHDGVQRLYSDQFRGFSLFIAPGGKPYASSLRLATLIGRHLRGAGLSPTLHHAEPIDGENRPLLDAELGVYTGPFVVLTQSQLPAVLIEVGVIAHRDEETDLEQPSYRARMQTQIIAALLAYCEQHK